MSEDKTEKLNESKSFEDRVFARFDSVEGRLGNVEIRITKLEDRQYDTKPIWEQALAAILEVKSDVAELKSDVAELKTGLAETNANIARNTADLSTNSSHIATLQTEVVGLRAEMQAGFTSVRNEIEHERHIVMRKLDAISDSWLELRGDQRYLDRRLGVLEEHIKPT